MRKGLIQGENMTTYKNREDAGKKLVESLRPLQIASPILMAIPRGGVPVAASLGTALGWRPQILPLRHLALPHSPENPFGCIDAAGEIYLNQALVGQLRVSPSQIRQLARQAHMELIADQQTWGCSNLPHLQGQTVVLVDDGIHSGWTLFSAIRLVRSGGAARIIVACPVSTARAFQFLAPHCDPLLCPVIDPQPLFSIASHYSEFPVVTDEKIHPLLVR
jgi:putative phosphoribosyl transferase